MTSRKAIRREIDGDEDGLRTSVLAWLGYWRDEMPAEAVKQLQALTLGDQVVAVKRETVR